MVINSTSDTTSGNNPLSRQKPSALNATSTEAATQKSAQTASAGDVTLSSEAQTLKRLEEKIHATSGVDTAKVDVVRQKIADGSYQVDSMRVAEALLKYEQ